MKKLVLFNNKGGVGKTTLSINIAIALANLGLKVLTIDADPQCNLTSFFLSESQLDKILGESDEDNTNSDGETIWSSIKPVVRGRGGVASIAVHETSHPNVFLAPGDVLLTDYEEDLPDAWTRSFARNERGYDVIRALSDSVNLLADQNKIDIVIYDVGPNVGPLNRVILLDSDFFITPVAADLFSLRALTTVGGAIKKWVNDYATIQSLAPKEKQSQLLKGKPQYLGYITSAFKVHTGHRASDPHEQWENRIASRVKNRIIDVLNKIDPYYVPFAGNNKIGSVKNYQSLAPSAQEFGVGIGQLLGRVNTGYNQKITEATENFSQIASKIKLRMEL